MAIDQTTSMLYTSDDLKRVIAAYSLTELKVAGRLILSNSYVTKLLVDSNLQRMYAATREGQLLFIDISDA